MDLRKVKNEEKLNLCKKYYQGECTTLIHENVFILNVLFAFLLSYIKNK